MPKNTRTARRRPVSARSAEPIAVARRLVNGMAEQLTDLDSTLIWHLFLDSTPNKKVGLAAIIDAARARLPKSAEREDDANDIGVFALGVALGELRERIGNVTALRKR